MAEGTRRSSAGRYLRWGAIALVVAGLSWFVHQMDWASLGAALASAKLWPLALGAALSFVNLFCKGASWKLMLGRRYPVPLTRIVRYTVAAFAVSAVTPARAGEALRIWFLKDRDGVPPADSVAIAAAEKILDVVSMVLVVAPLPWLLPGLPAWVGHSVLGVTLLAAALLGVAWLASERPFFVKLLGKFSTALAMLRRPGMLLGALAVLVASWIADLLSVWLVFYSAGLDLPLAAGLLVLLTLNMAIALPSTPAQVGTLELGAVAGLTVLGVPSEQAFAFALLYHGMQILPLIAVGALDARFVLSSRRASSAGLEPAP